MASAPHPQIQEPRVQDAGSDVQEITPASKTPSAPKPLQADNEFQTLSVPGYRDGVIALPLGIIEERPVLVALHGNYDRPEWQCMVWSELIRHQAFVVCPRGVPRTDAPKSEDRWTYGGIPDTLKETYAALAAARAAYPEYVDPGPAMFTGFSLGAIYGVHALGADAKKRAAYGAGEEPPFGYAVLVEGGYQGWYPGRAKQFRADGARGVVFGCGQYACRAKANGLVKLLERADLRVGVGFGGNVGHTYDGQVAAAVASQLPAMFGDDPRWKPVVDALSAAESR
ncbi:MAG: hypothetical protein H6718_28150 [Polyangiaceae bacterium]|nr:hypothetical protein [Polyangiaceae bacterium]